MSLAAVDTRIVVITHDINQAERIADNIKLPTDDEDAHPLS